jgi:hypothetical protein
MRVTVIENPKPSQQKVNFKVDGEWCTCYVQGDAWEPGCEQVYDDWLRTPGCLKSQTTSTHKTVMDDTTPWYGAVVCDGVAPTWPHGNHYYVQKENPGGLWVGCRLSAKRTRNPKCFRGVRYFVAWLPGTEPPCSVDAGLEYVMRAPFPQPPRASEVPPPFGLSF